MKKLIWYAMLTIAAIVVVGVGMDRASRKNPGLLNTVPGPFRSFALEGFVKRSIAHGDAANTLAQAEALVRKRPIPSENLSALAVVEQAAGDDAASSRVLAVAASRGWRDPMVQYSLVFAGAPSGAWDMAAQRLAALWAVSENRALLHPASKELTRSVQGRAALADVLAENVPANNAILTWLSGAVPVEQAGALVSKAIRGGARFNCQSLADLATTLANRGMVHLSRQVWSGACRHDAFSASPTNPVFIQKPYGALNGPFDWNLPQTASVNSELSRQGRAIGLDVRNRATFHIKVADKRFALMPGRHRFRLAVSKAGTADAINLAMLCLPGKQVIASSQVSTAASVQVKDFVVPMSGCAVQHLSLMAAPGVYEGIVLSIL